MQVRYQAALRPDYLKKNRMILDIREKVNTNLTIPAYLLNNKACQLFKNFQYIF